MSICVNLRQGVAQTVSVTTAEGESGHGFTIKDGSICWLVLPKHVASQARSVTVSSAEPIVHTKAIIERPFWESMDLAVGQLRGDLAARCTLPLSVLDASLRPGDGRELWLQRLRPSGALERVPMQITKTEHLLFEAKVSDPRFQLHQGTSGAFLFDGDRPMGMIIQAIDESRGRFIRIEEIAFNIGRFITRKGIPMAVLPEAGPVASGEDERSSLDFEVISASLPGITPEQEAKNLSGPGPYVFALVGANQIAFRVTGEASVVLSRLVITTPLEEGLSKPRDIHVEVASDAQGRGVRPFAASQMDGNGVLRLQGAPTRARWVYVTVRSAWDSAPVGIDEVRFY